ncbi:MAG TPA: recombinase RecT, partial [Anaerolineales bacterium]|nr:recombinase RecT [Anaerolineales bacterium]
MPTSTDEITHARRQPDTIKSLLSRPEVLDRIRAVAPKYLSAERVAKILLLTCQRDQKLLRCTPQSLLAAVMRAAQMGLEPDGRLCHLIPYKDTVNVIIDWKGLVEIARRNGLEAKAVLVRERDDFECLEDDGSGRTNLRHQVNVH